ncbi:MAG: rayT [Planctomycetaceae bacterium]|nr:rayT [Planctomycetaceae bacterium]
MPRNKRICPAGDVFHVLNRAMARLTFFENPGDDTAFMKVLNEIWEAIPLPILALVVMPNHWHFVVRPATDTQVCEFFQRLTTMHSMRWHAHDKTGGTGPLYQGRFKSFPVQNNEYLLTVMRYVERNPQRANFVERAEDWTWSSAHARLLLVDERRWLSIPTEPALPDGWRTWVNTPATEAEVESLRNSVRKGLPFGNDQWIRSSAVRLGLETTLRPRGRPKKNA